MINRRRLILSLVIILTLTSCGTSPNSKTKDTNSEQVQFTKLNTSGSTDQDISNQAKDIIIKFDEITAVQAVNSDKDLVATIEIEHLKRFNLKKIKQKIEKAMKKEISNLDIFISTDKKIILELEKIENDIKLENLTEKDIDTRLKKLIKLMKEQT